MKKDDSKLSKKLARWPGRTPLFPRAEQRKQKPPTVSDQGLIGCEGWI